ncbi:hypothetical protein VCHA53O466_40335 [Vibrio chagasii]|nr:hypothetical protein VCHA53O466_40335 [Vibrio chagasii]
MKFKLLSCVSVIVPVIAFSDDLSDELLGKAMSSNEKFTCTPAELDVYIASATKSLFVPLAITSPNAHIENQMAKKQIEGDESSCISLAMDGDLWERLDELIEKLENLNIEIPPNILDSLMKSLMKRMRELYDGICNVFTEEFAQKKIEEFVDNKSEVKVKDLKKMDTAENRKSMLAKRGQSEVEGDLKDRGLDKRWANKDEWDGAAHDVAKDKVSDVVDDIFGM